MLLTDFKITKPFDGFKWRWMDFTPVESFNRPDIFLGIVRAIGDCDGLNASDQAFINRLAEVQLDLDKKQDNINLIPTDPSRNVIRRQGRYWSGTGVLEKSSDRKLHLTELGKDLANGSLAVDEFATDFIFRHKLPNEYIESEATVKVWNDNGLEIYPLLIILRVLGHLHYLTPDEVVKILVPLSAYDTQLKSDQFAEAVLEFRDNPPSADHFPNCAPGANDARMVREHLLFLENFEVLRLESNKSEKSATKREQYYLDELGKAILDSFEFGEYIIDNPVGGKESGEQNKKRVPHYDVDFGAVRRKKMALIASRPNQAKFRNQVISAYKGRCILTGENILDVIDACHIIDYSNGGPDILENSLCLRTDLHTLFDRGKLRISKDSEVVLSGDLLSGSSYSDLQGNITLPCWVNRNFLDKKFKYGSTFL